MPVVLPLAIHAQEEADLNVFEDGNIIYAEDMNENFENLDGRLETYESAIHVDGETGNVGIGTTAPTADLEVSRDQNGDADIRILNNGGGTASRSILWVGEYASAGNYGYLAHYGGNYTASGLYTPNTTILSGDDTGGLMLITGSASSIKFGIGSTERMRIDSAGNVGIGTTAPQQRLHVAGNVIADDYLYNSDIRLKTDIAPLANALDGVQCLQAVTYRWSDPQQPQDVQIGLIAQDVEECFPEVVSTNEDGYKTVSYARLVAPLIEAAKEQQRVNAGQQATISQQEDEIARLKAQQKQTDARLARLEALVNAGQ